MNSKIQIIRRNIRHAIRGKEPTYGDTWRIYCGDFVVRTFNGNIIFMDSTDAYVANIDEFGEVDFNIDGITIDTFVEATSEPLHVWTPAEYAAWLSELARMAAAVKQCATINNVLNDMSLAE